MVDNALLLSQIIFKVNPPEPVNFSQMHLLLVVSASSTNVKAAAVQRQTKENVNVAC